MTKRDLAAMMTIVLMAMSLIVITGNFRLPKVATPHIPDFSNLLLFRGDIGSVAVGDTSRPVKPPADTMPIFMMREPEIRQQIAQWQQYQTQLQQEFSRAQGRIDVYTEMLQGLQKRSAIDTTKQVRKKK